MGRSFQRRRVSTQTEKEFPTEIDRETTERTTNVSTSTVGTTFGGIGKSRRTFVSPSSNGETGIESSRGIGFGRLFWWPVCPTILIDEKGNKWSRGRRRRTLGRSDSTTQRSSEGFETRRRVDFHSPSRKETSFPRDLPGALSFGTLSFLRHSLQLSPGRPSSVSSETQTSRPTSAKSSKPVRPTREPPKPPKPVKEVSLSNADPVDADSPAILQILAREIVKEMDPFMNESVSAIFLLETLREAKALHAHRLDAPMLYLLRTLRTQADRQFVFFLLTAGKLKRNPMAVFLFLHRRKNKSTKKWKRKGK